jgi:hypothetical protein
MRSQIGFGMGLNRGGGGAGPTYATWNPADTSADISLTGGDLIATLSTGAAWKSARATVACSSGKWYWEVSIGVGSTTVFAGGVGNASALINSYFTQTADGYGYYAGTGGKQTNSSLTAYGAAYSPGDIIGAALDVDGRTLEFFKNGASQGVIDVSSVTGDLYPMCAIYANGESVTANFGASAFSYSPPVGYNSGVYVP